jgi:pilus assembly protein Flp/PilA
MIEYFRALRARHRDDDGASGVEYGLLVAAIAAVIVALVFILGQWVFKAFDDTCQNIATKGQPDTVATCDAPPAPAG